jgi:anti-sigma factor RsiW
VDNQEAKIEALLHAFIDNRLDSRMRDRVKKYLRKNPGQYQEVNAFNSLDSQLRRLFNSVHNDLALESFAEVVQNYGGEIQPSAEKKPKKVRHHSTAPQLAIYASVIMVALSAGYLSSEFFPTDAKEVVVQQPSFGLRQLAVEAHLLYSGEKAHAVEVNAKEGAKLVKWLSSKIGVEVAPAKLDEYGFKLLGGRLLPSLGLQAAFYLYSGEKDKTISLYMRPSVGIDSTVELRCAQESSQKLSICSWRGEKLVYIVIGKIPIGEHISISQEAVNQLIQ